MATKIRPETSPAHHVMTGDVHKNDIEGAKEELDQSLTESNEPTKEQWNNPRINTYRYFATLLTFTVMGMNDAAYGALIPYLEVYYNINYTVISLVFLAPFIGYTLAAIFNNKIHVKFGQLGAAVIGPSCKIICYSVTCAKPPYAVLAVIFVFSGFGIGLLDGAFNAWVGNMEHANELLGFLHGAYGLGATISPLLATAVVTKAGLQWNIFYYLMIGLSFVELVICVFSFRRATGAVYRAANPQKNEASGHSNTKEAMLNPVTWICSILLLCYVGVEVSLGGWLVTFMLKVRHGGAFESGMVVMGFWLGITFGRVILGFITGRIGEKIAIAIYLAICVALELCFWLIPNFISSAIFAAWLGFFLGPLFPAGIVVATKILPQRLHVSAIGFASAFGGGGAAVFPFAVGAIAQAKGVQVLQPIALALIVVILGLWCSLPGGFRKGGLEESAQDKITAEGGQATGMWTGRVNRLKNRLGMRRAERP